ncbi:hypothetical protein [Pseudomaricurvus sp. HS19]|uniref:hypothetical protein n=1 Tax=Pseudomaricurvus sp. HS19 TaxID=2692626 RepID=UPI0013709E21|nr:hypothetical protein [Pseudomaricurvus sp. HS19]MYM64088.1 hypothetical protein [Pseudomaricurvus sp. HS19]
MNSENYDIEEGNTIEIVVDFVVALSVVVLCFLVSGGILGIIKVVLIAGVAFYLLNFMMYGFKLSKVTRAICALIFWPAILGSVYVFMS